MPGFDLKKIFKKKPKKDLPDSDIPLPKENGSRDSSMQYVNSPSALEYPGIKPKVIKTPPAKKTKKIPKEEKPKDKDEKDDLPRCPKCGWAIGFEDNSCVNCGQKIRD